jgi:hypothetical protein
MRRSYLIYGLALLTGLPGMIPQPAAAADVITVYKTPTCGCCIRWIGHLQANGFEVVAHDLEDLTAVKRRHGVSAEVESCHTALVDGYVIEGHVPAADIRRLLKERPKVTGLTVPDMPVGSPGMEGPNPEPYDVLTFEPSGRTKVFSSHDPR